MTEHKNLATGRTLKRGARPTSRARLAAAMPFQIEVGTLPEYIFALPAQMNMQGNDQYGDCVSAEEAQNKCVGGVYIQEATTISWATANGDLDGADLEPVIEQMEASGMSQDGNIYGDGSPQAINYTDAPTMQAAIYQAITGEIAGQVKMGVAADQLPSGAGNANGWILTGASPDQNEDHCMGVCGYGTLAQFAAAIQQVYGITVTIPSGVDPTTMGYAVYTWSTIGWADVQSWVNISGEAWIRTPNTTISGTGTPTPDNVTIVQPTQPTPVPNPTPPGPTPNPPTPNPNCNRPIVLLAESLLAYVATLPAPVPAWLAAIAADALALINALCPSKAKMFM
jgi:hypothetical protein